MLYERRVLNNILTFKFDNQTSPVMSSIHYDIKKIAVCLPKLDHFECMKICATLIVCCASLVKRGTSSRHIM